MVVGQQVSGKAHGSMVCPSLGKWQIGNMDSLETQQRVRVGNDQENVQSERNSLSKTEMGNPQLRKRELRCNVFTATGLFQEIMCISCYILEQVIS